MIHLTARARIVRHRVAAPGWPNAPLRIALLTDFHANWPFVRLDHLRAIAKRTMDEAPDLILLGGDFLIHRSFPGRPISARDSLAALSGLTAPLGVFGVLGNHDWKDCAMARSNGLTRSSVEDAFADSPFRLLRNEAAKIHNFWLVGFDSQCPLGDWSRSFADPDRAFAQVPPDEPAILLAHEPDYFAKGDHRATLQLSGHTHGGQGNLMGWRPMVPSQFGSRYAHGHIVEGGRHLVVSGGLGFTGLPLRIAQRPEITLVTLTGV